MTRTQRDPWRLNREGTGKKNTLSILVSTLYLDRQLPFYLLIGILLIKNP